MDKRTREKTALVVFALLVVFAAAVLLSYFSTGRSWSVAASFVDDTVGSMEGYTAIVYGGTTAADESSRLENGEEAGAFAGEGGLSGERALEEAPGGASPGEGDAAFSAGAPSEEDLSSDIAAANSLGLEVLSLLPPLGDDADEGVFVSDVRDLYERKGSGVLSLDLSDLDGYADPMVFSVGEKRIGVYAVDYYATKARLKSYERFFEENDADAVVGLVSRSGLLATYEGTDVVVVADGSGEGGARGETVGDALVVNAPPEDEVGVVVLTSNNVPSAKAIDAL